MRLQISKRALIKFYCAIPWIVLAILCLLFAVKGFALGATETEIGGRPDLLQLHIPFTGSWQADDSPLLIKPGDFADLTNMRPNNTGIEGVFGYSKINDSIINSTYLKIKNGFHFVKDDPASESHVLVQAYNSGLTASKVYENTTAIPGAGDFTATELHTDGSGASRGQFSSAPQNTAVYCNGVDVPQVWPGDKGMCHAFITSTAVIGNSLTNPKDYTPQVQNSLSTSDQVALIGGGTTFSMLLHCEGADASTTFTDTVGTHTPSAQGNAQIDTDQLKFGTASGLLDGTGDYVSVPDHADWFMSTGAFTIDTWARFNSFPMDSYTKLQLSCDGVDAATSFPDDSCDGVTITAQNSCQVDTAQKKFGTASMLLASATSDYATTTDSDSWDFGSDAFTISFWLRFNTVPTSGNYAGLFGQHDTNTSCFNLVFLGTGSLQFSWANGSSGDTHSFSWEPIADTWYHLAVIRGWGKSDSTIALTVDGEVIGTDTISGQLPNVGAVLRIGSARYVTGGSYEFLNGWIDEFRVSKGIARWTAEFTPETSAYLEDLYQIIFNQQVDANNFARLYYDACAESLKFSITSSSTETVAISGSWSPVVNAWYHLAVIRGWQDAANTWAITVNGSDVGTVSDSDPWPDFAAAFDIGKCDDADFIYFDGWFDEFRVWKGTAAWADDFTPPSRAYAAASGYGIIGSAWRLDGVYFDVASANTTTSVITMEEWTGTDWSSLSVSDGTSSGGVSLAQDGWMTWPTTETTSEQKFIAGYPWYWYQFYLSAGAADIAQVTVDAPMQNITNIWDGTYSTCAAAMVYEATNTDYADYADEVNWEITTDVMVLDSLEATNDYVLLGFAERQQAIEISMPAGKENSTANTTLALYYWTGDAWTAVSGLYDGTEVGSVSLSASGVISWSPPSPGSEFPKSYAGEDFFYYYKLAWDENLDSETEVYFVRGIRATDDLLPYDFSLCFQNRLLLFNRDGNSSEVRVSKENTSYIFTGDDTDISNVGAGTGLTAATSLLNSYESSIDAVVIVCRDSETWALRESGDGGPRFVKQQLSSTIGCPAPLTMRACEVVPGLNVAMWVSYDGPYVSDGVTVKPVPGVEPYFDPHDPLFIGYSSLESASGFVDPLLKEYNLLIGDNWLIYDIQRSKWTKKDPPTYPECGWQVQDTDGGRYCYLGYDTGYMMRNEHTNAFDGSDIEQSVTLADMTLAGIGYESEIDFIKCTLKTKCAGDQDSVAIKYRADGDGDWTSLTSVPMYEYDNSYLLAVAHHTAPYLTIYNVSDWSKRDNPHVLPTDDGKGVAFSHNDALLAHSCASSPFVENYNTSTWGTLPEPETLPVSDAHDLVFSHDDSLLAVPHVTTPYITIYTVCDWNKIDNPATLPASHAVGAAFSHDDAWLAVAHASSPYVTIYTTSDWAKVTNPGTLPTGDGKGVAFNDDSSLLAVAHAASPYVTIYNTSAWTKVTNPGTLPTGTAYDVAFNYDGTLLAITHAIYPYITIYNTSDWSKVANPSTLPTGEGRGLAFNHGVKRYVQHTQVVNKQGVAHQLQLSVSTDDKTRGFEPIGLDLFYKPLRTDTTID